MRNPESAVARPPLRSRPQSPASGLSGSVPTAAPLSPPPRASLAQWGASHDRAHVYQSAWLARALATSKPARHADISSSACFAAVASAFLPVDFYEFDPLGLNLSNLRTGILDFDPLPFRDDSVPSLSSAGVVEWLGPDGSGQDLQAMRELSRVVAPDGSLLIALPVGRPRAFAGARRAYTFGHVLDLFARFELEEFFLIGEAVAGEQPLMNPDPDLVDRQEYGIGCFWLRKRPLQSRN